MNRLPSSTTAPTALSVTGCDPRTERIRPDTAGGYLTSSIELRAGLDISLLAISQTPADVLRELQRLRQCWELPAQAARAA